MWPAVGVMWDFWNLNISKEMANIQQSINPSVKAAIFEALQAGVSENTALIKEAEIYLKTVESTPVFHLTLIVSSIK